MDELKEGTYACLVMKKFPADEGTVNIIPFLSMDEEGVYTGGTTIEGVVTLALDRLRYVNSKFSCRENAVAITKLQEAIMWLEEGTRDRVERGVEGKHED